MPPWPHFKCTPRGYSGFQVTGIMDYFVFEIFDSGIFWVTKFGKYYFGWLDLSSDFFGHSEQSACVSQRHSSEITVQPNLFSFLEIFKAQKFGMGFSAPLDHPCHLNLECFPWECTHAQSCYTAKDTCSHPALRL